MVLSSEHLLEVKQQEPILNTSLSTKQQISGGEKQNPIECTEENIGKRLRKVGGRATWSLMGLPDNI